jgi:hypothetical protein
MHTPVTDQDVLEGITFDDQKALYLQGIKHMVAFR